MYGSFNLIHRRDVFGCRLRPLHPCNEGATGKKRRRRRAQNPILLSLLSNGPHRKRYVEQQSFFFLAAIDCNLRLLERRRAHPRTPLRATYCFFVSSHSPPSPSPLSDSTQHTQHTCNAQQEGADERADGLRVHKHITSMPPVTYALHGGREE